MIVVLCDNQNKKQLYEWALSNHLWTRRISIVSTLYFIKNNGPLSPTLKLAEIFLDDSEDLIQKATGWMLRELGKVNRTKLDQFLTNFHSNMPRVMLRYSLEKHSLKARKRFM